MRLESGELQTKRAKVTQYRGELGLDKTFGCGEAESWGTVIQREEIRWDFGVAMIDKRWNSRL